MKKWRISIIGFGWAGEQHAKTLQKFSDRAEICALADTNSPLVTNKASLYKVPAWTTDYRGLFDRTKIDAVCICLPHDIHAEAAIAAARAGLHVLVEKPLANTLAEANAMIQAADKAGVILMVAENVRYHSTNLKAAELIRAGILGEIFKIRINREHQMHDYLRRRPWFLRQKAAGIMVSGGIHDYELLRMLGGEINHVYGVKGLKTFPEMLSDDESAAIAQMVNGAVAVLSENYSLRTPRPGVSGSVHGSRGSLWFQTYGNVWMDLHGGIGIKRDDIQIYTADDDGKEDTLQAISVVYRNTFEDEMSHFLDCMDTGKEPVTSGREERKPLVAVLATYESFKRGERVYLTEIEKSDFNWEAYQP